jgi:hypothetical protein
MASASRRSTPPISGGGVGLQTHHWVDSGKLIYYGYMEQIQIGDVWVTTAVSGANNVKITGPLDAPRMVTSYALRP